MGSLLRLIADIIHVYHFPFLVYSLTYVRFNNLFIHTQNLPFMLYRHIKRQSDSLLEARVSVSAWTYLDSLAPRSAPMHQGRAPRGHTLLSTNAEKLTTRLSGVKSFVVSLSERRNLNNTWRKHTHTFVFRITDTFRFAASCS